MMKRKSQKWFAVLTAMVVMAVAAFTVSVGNKSNKAEAAVIGQGAYVFTASYISLTSFDTVSRASFASLSDEFGTTAFSVSEFSLDFQSPAQQYSGSYITFSSPVTYLRLTSSLVYFLYSSSVSNYSYFSALANARSVTFSFTCIPSGYVSPVSFVFTLTTPYRLAVSSGSGDADQIISEYKKTTEFEQDVKASTWYTQLETERDNLASQVTSLTTQVTSLTSQVETLTAQVSDLETQVGTLTADKTSLQTQVGTLTREKETLETQLQTALVAYADLEEQYNSLLESQIPVSDYEALLREKQGLERQVTVLQENVQTLNARIVTLTNQVNTAEQTGYDRGYEEGHDSGYTEGYGEGITASQGQSLATWDGFFPSLFGSIAGFFVTVLGGTTIFGFSLWQLLLSVLAVIAIVAILKVVIR